MATNNSSNDIEIPDNLVTAKGDLVTATGNNAPAKLAKGTDGQVLTALDSETTGLKWKGLTYTDVGAAAAAHAHASIDATADSSIAADKKFLLEGAAGDSYIIYNSTAKRIELYVDGVLASTWGYHGLNLLMDGTTSILDLISAAAFTKTGGVSNAWPGDSSNFRTLLGAQAPVIAQATDNLLSDENASFEGGTSGGWGSITNATVANDVTQYWHGIYSLKVTAVTTTNCSAGLTVTAATSASTQYTLSMKFKGVVGRSYTAYLWDTTASFQFGSTVTADGTWQTVTVTQTFGTGAVRKVGLWGASMTAGTSFYVDAVQLEAGAVATPFALDYRTASTCKIATPLTVGGDATIVAIVNGPWPGNDGIEHTLFSASGAGAGDVFRLYKGTDNKLYFAVGDKSAVTAALTTTTWAANANHLVIGTVTGGAINVYLAGSAGTPATGATREAAFNADSYIGTKTDGTLPANAAILGAAYDRVISSAENTALTSIATWGTAALGSLPTIGSTRFDDATDRLYVYTSNGWKYAALT